MVDSALQRARKRALGSKTKEAAPADPQSKAPTNSVRTVRMQMGEVVPKQYSELSPQSQQRTLELVREQETKEKDDNLALKAANQVIDIKDRDRAEIRALKGQLESLLSIVAAMQRRLDAKDNQLEIAKSEALA